MFINTLSNLDNQQIYVKLSKIWKWHTFGGGSDVADWNTDIYNEQLSCKFWILNKALQNDIVRVPIWSQATVTRSTILWIVITTTIKLLYV